MEQDRHTPRVVGSLGSTDDFQHESNLRPERLADFVGQQAVAENLRVYIEAARRRGRSLDHILFSGPPGLGKTSLAHVVAEEMGVHFRGTSGPAIERTGDLAALLSQIEPGEVLFIDEIHRLGTVVEEVLYPAMEDFELDLMMGQGPAARAIRMALPPFTLIGATTRSGLLSAPFRDRFGIIERLDFYPPKDLEHILARAADRLQVELDSAAATEIGSRSRGTPRVALRLLRRIRDFADVDASGQITFDVAKTALGRLGVDELGLDALDRRLLEVIIEHYGGGPVGLGTLSASLGEEQDTLEEVCEPYLIQIGFLERTPRGRVATPHAARHLGRDLPGRASLFETE